MPTITAVSRIDPKTNAVVQTIQVGNGPAGVAVGGGFVWVANSLDGTVSKIDPRTNNAVDTKQVGNRPRGVAFGEHGVWVANSSDRTLMRIDPRSGTLRGTIPVGPARTGSRSGRSGLGDERVERQRHPDRSPDRERDQDDRTSAPARARSRSAAGAVWVANSLDGTVSRIDAASNRVAATIPVGDGPSGVGVTSRGTVWVSNELAGTLSRIDPARNEVVETVRTGNRPEGLAPTGDTIYVAVRASGLAHRGGTLDRAGQEPSDSIDPALVADPWDVLVLTNDGLTGFRRTGGSDGARLVPDLATALPTPTDGGRTYTFQLRPGIRYSTGRARAARRLPPRDRARAARATRLLRSLLRRASSAPPPA